MIVASRGLPIGWHAASLLACLVLLLTNVSPAPGAELTFSGTLGQSQPPAAKPLPFLEAVGVVADTRSHLWTAANKTLFEFIGSANQQWRWVRRIALPYTIAANIGFKGDGRRIFFELRNHKIYSFDPRTRRLAAVVPLSGAPTVLRRFHGLRLAVAPAQLRQGWARRAKYFLLDTKSRAVYAFGRNGASRGKVLSLPVPAKAKSRYVGITIAPGSGDLLVASGYPDSRVYRFNDQGGMVTRGGWPRNKVGARILIRSRGQAWALDNDQATSLPATISVTNQSRRIPLPWTTYPSGFAQDRHGDVWIASSQGLVEFSPWNRPMQRRLGGLPGVGAVTISPGGTVFATVDQGQRIVRLMLDDRTDGALHANANEPFRIGFGWNEAAADIAWDG